MAFKLGMKLAQVLLKIELSKSHPKSFFNDKGFRDLFTAAHLANLMTFIFELLKKLNWKIERRLLLNLLSKIGSASSVPSIVSCLTLAL
jgi:hypothetical protein